MFRHLKSDKYINYNLYICSLKILFKQQTIKLLGNKVMTKEKVTDDPEPN